MSAAGESVFPYPADDPGAVADAARRCRALAGRCEQGAVTLHGESDRLVAAWGGPAADACTAELRRTASLTRRLSGPLLAAAGQLAHFTECLQRARSEIDRIRSRYDGDVQRQQLALVRTAVDPLVPPQLRRLAVEDLRVAHRDELAAHHRAYDDVVDDLRRQARSTERALLRLAWSVLPGSPALTGSPADAESVLAAALPMLATQRRLVGGTGGRLPAAGTPPSTVRAWWELLTEDERSRLLAAAPAALGNLGGLPARVRSVANEAVLDRLLADLRTRAALHDDDQRLRDTCTAVRGALDLARRGSSGGGQLLVFEPAAFGGDGRVAIGVGDVDAADHVAFLVPGLDATVRGSMSALVDRSRVLADQANRRRPGTPTAVVAWLGYDAPGVREVGLDHAAELGGDLLAADVRAVQASRALAPHLTLIGHSYGSTTAGTALRDHESGVDDLVLLGSPGANVESAAELRIDRDHVFVGASSRDPVSYLDWFGLDPSHESFGAVRFRAEDVTRNSWRVDVDDHSKYFTPGSESMTNVVRVVVGRGDDVDVAAYREEVRFLPDGINSDPEADREPTAPAG